MTISCKVDGKLTVKLLNKCMKISTVRPLNPHRIDLSIDLSFDVKLEMIYNYLDVAPDFHVL